MKMGTVDVERYTGPCLITTAVRPKPKPRPGVANNDSPSSLPSSSNGGDGDNKHVSSGGVGVGGGGGSGSSNGGPISHHHHHYPQLPINDPRNWAGAPLLSMAASIRKTKNGGGNGTGGGGGGGGGVNKNWHPPPVYLPAPIMHPATAMEGYAPHSSHLQGAPLIRVPRQQQQQQQQQQSFHKKNNMPVVVHGPSMTVSARRPLVYHQPTMPPTPVTPPSPLPAALLQQSTGQSSVTTMEMTSESGDAGSSSGCPSSSSDTCSVTSDEGLASGGSDSSLPRIIKPRKRRKKPGQESSSLLLHHHHHHLHHHQRVATKGHHLNGGGGIASQDLTGSTALSELDDLLSNQGDSLAQLFRHTSLSASAKTGCSSSSSSTTSSSSSSGATTTTSTSGSDNCILPSAQSPPLWPGQSCVEDDIWSSGCWHSLSPVWSPSGSSSGHPSPSSSSSSCWPDQRVIRRPDRQRNHGGQFQQPSPTSVPYLDLPTSSFLTGMPELMQQQQQQQQLQQHQQQQQHFEPEEERRRHNLLGNDLQLHLESPPPPLGHYLQVSSQLIASPFNGHRDIEIRFFSSTAQATHNNNTVTTTEEIGDVVAVPEQLLNNNNNTTNTNNSREHSVSSSPDFPR